MVLSIRPTPQYKNMTASSRQVSVTLNATGNVCVYVCVSSKPLLTIDHHFFPMTLSIHPDFKRGGRNRMTGVGGNVWGKCKCSRWLLQTAGLAWVGFFKQLLLVDRKQLLTDEKRNTANFCLFPALAVMNWRACTLPLRLGPLDTERIHLPSKLPSPSIFPNIYFLPVSRPVLNFRFGKGLDWLLALETFLHEWFLYCFGRHIIISAERERSCWREKIKP